MPLYPWRRDRLPTPIFLGFPSGSDGKLGFDPWVGGPPGGVYGNPLQYSCLENPHGQRSLVGCSPWGHAELDTTEPLSVPACLCLPGSFFDSPAVRFICVAAVAHSCHGCVVFPLRAMVDFSTLLFGDLGLFSAVVSRQPCCERARSPWCCLGHKCTQFCWTHAWGGTAEAAILISSLDPPEPSPKWPT